VTREKPNRKIDLLASALREPSEDVALHVRGYTNILVCVLLNTANKTNRIKRGSGGPGTDVNKVHGGAWLRGAPMQFSMK
jgi:hypothetical protein